MMKGRKTLQELVFKLVMDRIGVEDNEEFQVKCPNQITFHTYKFSKCKLYMFSDENWTEIHQWDILIRNFEDHEFKTKGFNPDMSELYFYITTGGSVSWKRFKNTTADCLNRCVGNCFRTKETAEINKDKILNIFKEGINNEP